MRKYSSKKKKYGKKIKSHKLMKHTQIKNSNKLKLVSDEYLFGEIKKDLNEIIPTESKDEIIITLDTTVEISENIKKDEITLDTTVEISDNIKSLDIVISKHKIYARSMINPMASIKSAYSSEFNIVQVPPETSVLKLYNPLLSKYMLKIPIDDILKSIPTDNYIICVGYSKKDSMDPYDMQCGVTGSIKKNGETPKQAANRELSEELGITIKKSGGHYFKSTVNMRYNDRYVHHYVIHTSQCVAMTSDEAGRLPEKCSGPDTSDKVMIWLYGTKKETIDLVKEIKYMCMMGDNANYVGILHESYIRPWYDHVNLCSNKNPFYVDDML